MGLDTQILEVPLTCRDSRRVMGIQLELLGRLGVSTVTVGRDSFAAGSGHILEVTWGL